MSVSNYRLGPYTGLRLRLRRSRIEGFDSDSILNLHHEKREIFFLLHSNYLTLYMLVNEKKSATFSSTVEIRGKKHHKNAHNNKCHIYYSLNYDKKIFEVSRSRSWNRSQKSRFPRALL
jgi:hypothetical protein